MISRIPSALRAPRCLALVLALLPFLAAASPDDAPVRLARVEGALSSLTTDAGTLAAHARKVAESGHFHGMAQLSGDAFLLHRQVLSTRLAIDYLLEMESP